MDLFTKLNQPNFLFDSHCHLNDKAFDNDREQTIQHSKDAGVELIFDISVDTESSRKSLEISGEHGAVKSFVGIDPDILIPGSSLFTDLNKSNGWFTEQKETLRQLITNNPQLVSGIGETGMDYYWLGRNKELKHELVERSKLLQEKLFRTHLELAEELKLPLSVHSRGAEQDCLNIVNEYPELVGIFHSFTGDFEIAKKILGAGWGLGVNGIVTYKNAQEIRDMYKKILGSHNFSDWEPSDFYKKGIYFETDSPFLSPRVKRPASNALPPREVNNHNKVRSNAGWGERNEPGNILTLYNHFCESIS